MSFHAKPLTDIFKDETMNISSLQSANSFFSAQANQPTRSSGNILDAGDESRDFKSTQHQLASGRNHSHGTRPANKGWRSLPAHQLTKGAPTPKPLESVSRFGGPKPAEQILRPGATPLPAQPIFGIFRSNDPPFLDPTFGVFKSNDPLPAQPTSGIFKSNDPPYASQKINAVIQSTNRAYFTSKDQVDISA